MAETTGIAWTDHTFNPWIGCQRVSPGCEHCYAEAMATTRPRLVYGPPPADLREPPPSGKKLSVWGPQAPRRVTSVSYWNDPLRWDRKAKADGVRRRVFCASLADVFEDDRPAMGRDEVRSLGVARADLWQLISRCDGLDWLLLTKRPQNVQRMVPAIWLTGKWPAHVWIGVSVEDQQRAEARLPHLLRIPAAVRFVSYEPALGPVDWPPWLTYEKHYCVHCRMTHMAATTCCGEPTKYIGRHDGIDWLIIGGESGPGARPFDLAWARSVLVQCKAAQVPVFVKQLGARPKFPGSALLHPKGSDGRWLRDKKGGDMEEWPEDLRVRQWPEVRR